jgi:hypothetical protein
MMSDAICRECETVAHCTTHGCIPKQPRNTIDMARKAGGYAGFTSPPTDWDAGDYVFSPSQLKAFEALVRADEREACAKLVFNSPPSDEYESPLRAVYNAIRARGETK